MNGLHSPFFLNKYEDGFEKKDKICLREIICERLRMK